MSGFAIAVAVLLAIAIVASLYVVVVYNRMATMRTRLEHAWAQIDVQLGHRHDLILGLNELVRIFTMRDPPTTTRSGP